MFVRKWHHKIPLFMRLEVMSMGNGRFEDKLFIFGFGFDIQHE